MRQTLKKIAYGVVTASLLFLLACTRPVPNHVDNVCLIFKQYPDWYWAAQDAHKKWGVPISVQMAIIHQESHFNAKARPPRERILWVIPWFRPTSAYGYSQALTQTWKRYKRESDRHASRDAFEDATDFVGWYAKRAHQRLGIPRNNAYKIYLAYHEGMGGYERKTYLRKRWLIRVAQKVQGLARRYQAQLNRCQYKLKRKPWWRRIF